MMQEDSQRFYGAHFMCKKYPKETPSPGKSCFNYWNMAHETQTKAERLAVSAAPNNRLTLFHAWMHGFECEYEQHCMYVWGERSWSSTVTDKRLSTWLSTITYAKFNFANENEDERVRKAWKSGTLRLPRQSQSHLQSQWLAKVMTALKIKITTLLPRSAIVCLPFTLLISPSQTQFNKLKKWKT